jgi:hypothetical protein
MYTVLSDTFGDILKCGVAPPVLRIPAPAPHPADPATANLTLVGGAWATYDFDFLDLY